MQEQATQEEYKEDRSGDKAGVCKTSLSTGTVKHSPLVFLLCSG